LLLSSCGLDLPHEHRMGADGICSWLFAAESSAAPWGPAPSAWRFEHVLHLVRDPLQAIPSIATLKTSAWKYVSRYVPIDPRAPVLVRAASSWLNWNARIESRAPVRVPVDRLGEELPRVSAHLALALVSPAGRPLPRDVNTRRHGRLLGSLEARCPGFGRV